MKSSPRLVRACLVALPAVLLASLSATASAQEAKGFNLDRFDPAERGSDWFVLDSLDLRGHKRHAVGDVTEFAYKPLVIYEKDGSERRAVVKIQSFTHIGTSLVLWDRFRAGFNIPVLFWQKVEDSHIGTTTYKPSTGSTIGDIRLAGDVRLFGKYRDPITMSAGLALYMPTGDRASYTGDGKVRMTPRVQAAGDFADFAWAGRIGFNYRAQDERFANTPMGSEISFALSGGIRAMNKTFLFGPELYGTTGVSDGAFFEKRTTPFEVLFGAHYRLTPDMHVDLGFGPGISRGLGAPLWRAVASIEWAPAYEPPAPPPPPDRDHDAIADQVDACPDLAGIWTDNPGTNGCPPAPPDADRDGVLDPDDACVNEPGVATQDPKTNGCPPPIPDTDKDGVLDPEDACPAVPGVATQDPKTNGCPPPPPDRDGDTIIDSEDACPDHPGPRDPDPKKNGCPVARVEGGQIRITEQVKFAFGSAKLAAESDGVLNAVLAVLQQHPDISKIRVEGHTDNHGADALNLQLSKDRAAAVAAWLTKHGIDKKRIESAGYGKTKPIDTNDTEAGRQNNRRVEFHIVKHDEKAADKPKEGTRGGEHFKGVGGAEMPSTQPKVSKDEGAIQPSLPAPAQVPTTPEVPAKSAAPGGPSSTTAPGPGAVPNVKKK